MEGTQSRAIGVFGRRLAHQAREDGLETGETDKEERARDQHCGQALGIESQRGRAKQQQRADQQDKEGGRSQGSTPAAVRPCREREHGHRADQQHGDQDGAILGHLQAVPSGNDQREVEPE